MSDTETPAALEIPARALAFHDRPHRVLLTDADVADRIRDVAAPVVAAELRRLAQGESDKARARHETSSAGQRARDAEHDGAFWVIDALRARADELDPT